MSGGILIGPNGGRLVNANGSRLVLGTGACSCCGGTEPTGDCRDCPGGEPQSLIMTISGFAFCPGGTSVLTSFPFCTLTRTCTALSGSPNQSVALNRTSQCGYEGTYLGWSWRDTFAESPPPICTGLQETVGVIQPRTVRASLTYSNGVASWSLTGLSFNQLYHVTQNNGCAGAVFVRPQLGVAECQTATAACNGWGDGGPITVTLVAA